MTSSHGHDRRKAKIKAAILRYAAALLVSNRLGSDYFSVEWGIPRGKPLPALVMAQPAYRADAGMLRSHGIISREISSGLEFRLCETSPIGRDKRPVYLIGLA
jgi:hypothetical protein